MPEDRLKGRDKQFVAVMESAAHLQRLVPGAVLVGGSAAILYADHRESQDHDHVLPDLADRFEMEVLGQIDEYYADQAESEDGIASQLARQLGDPRPSCDRTTLLLSPPWTKMEELGHRGLHPRRSRGADGRTMTALAFRNVDASPDEPVERWPLEAIQTALERGSLEHWHRIAKAIKAQPWGSVARDVEEILSYNRPYGVAKTMERIIERARGAAEAAERTAVAAEVERLIKESGLSRRDFASRIGTSTSRLSTYATCKVVPSAALLLRMRSVASRG